MFPWSFPPAVPCPGAPLPSTGSLGSVPPLHRYYRGAPTPHRPSRLTSLPSLRSTVVASLLRSHRWPVACAREPGPFIAGGPPGTYPTETMGSPRFLDEPFRVCRALRPRRDLRARPSRRLHAASALADVRLPHELCLSRLHHAARTLAVYASQDRSPHRSRKTRFRLVARLRRAGLSPAGSTPERFRDAYFILPPSPGFSWRNDVRLLHGGSPSLGG